MASDDNEGNHHAPQNPIEGGGADGGEGAGPGPEVAVAAAGTVMGDGLRGYEVIKPIGKGKFAIVYRARRLADDTVVALKRVRVDQMDEKARTKALKEVRLVQSLNHPNVVQYLDSFLEGNELVIALEWAAAGYVPTFRYPSTSSHNPFH